MMPTSRGWCALAAGLVAVGLVTGCGGSDGKRDGGGITPQPGVHVVSQGEGETNTAPLWPIALGYRAGSVSVVSLRGDGEHPRFVAVSPQGGIDAHPPDTATQVYQLVDGDVYAWGTLVGGAFATPRLRVPHEVRVGMAWTNDAADGRPAERWNVTGRYVVPTPFGTRPVWIFYGQIATTVSDEPTAFDAVGFVEGYGGIGLTLSREIGGDNPPEGTLVRIDALDLIRVPLATETPAPAHPPHVTPTPIAGDRGLTGFDFTDRSGPVDHRGFIGGRVTAVATRAGGPVSFRVSGFGVAFGTGSDDNVSYTSAVGANVQGTADGDRIADLPVPENEPDAFVDGRSTFVAPDGSTFRIPVHGFDGAILARQPMLFASELAVFPDARGTVRVLGLSDFRDVWFLGEHRPDVPGAFRPGDAVGADPGNFVSPLDFGRMVQPIWRVGEVSPSRPSMAISIGPDAFAMASFLRDRLVFARVEHGRVTRAHDATTVFDGISDTAHPGGADHFEVFPDGRIERLVLTPDGVRTEPLVDVDLPRGDWLVGAFADGGSLVLVSERGYRGGGPFPGVLTPPDDWLLVNPPWLQLGDIHASRISMPAATPPVEPPPVLGVTARALDRDAVVCWPPTDARLERTGWTLGGQPAAGVLQVEETPDRNCALVVADRGAALDGTWVEGPLPGVGRLALAFPAMPTDPALTFDAAVHPLVDGRFLVGELLPDGTTALGWNGLPMLFGQGGVPIGPEPSPELRRAVQQSDAYHAFVDAAGVSWLLETSSGPACADMIDCTYVVRTEDGTGQSIMLPMSGAHVERGRDAGGVFVSGYVHTGPTQSAVVSEITPDGTVHPLETPTGYTHWVTLADGTVCGSRNRGDPPDGTVDVVCRPQGGPERSHVATGRDAEGGGLVRFASGGINVASGGDVGAAFSLLVEPNAGESDGYPSLRRFDPSVPALVREPVPVPAPAGEGAPVIDTMLAEAPDHIAYLYVQLEGFAAGVTDRRATLGTLGTRGFSNIALPGGAPTFSFHNTPGGGRLVVTRDLVMTIGMDGVSRWVRESLEPVTPPPPPPMDGGMPDAGPPRTDAGMDAGVDAGPMCVDPCGGVNTGDTRTSSTSAPHMALRHENAEARDVTDVQLMMWGAPDTARIVMRDDAGDAPGAILASADMPYTATPGWAVARFAAPVHLAAGRVYWIEIQPPTGSSCSLGWDAVNVSWVTLDAAGMPTGPLNMQPFKYRLGCCGR